MVNASYAKGSVGLVLGASRKHCVSPSHLQADDGRLHEKAAEQSTKSAAPTHGRARGYLRATVREGIDEAWCVVAFEAEAQVMRVAIHS